MKQFQFVFFILLLSLNMESYNRRDCEEGGCKRGGEDNHKDADKP